jgi:hypothetical protein
MVTIGNEYCFGAGEDERKKFIKKFWIFYTNTDVACTLNFVSFHRGFDEYEVFRHLFKNIWTRSVEYSDDFKRKN